MMHFEGGRKFRELSLDDDALGQNQKIKFPQKFLNFKKQRSNNSQNGSNFHSNDKSQEKSQNFQPQKLVQRKKKALAKHSSFKVCGNH